MEKIVYERAELEIIQFNSLDTITTSDEEYQGEIMG
jgi:hypothetical protein